MARSALFQDRNKGQRNSSRISATNQNKFLLIDEATGGLTPRGKKIINGTPMERYCQPEELTGTLLYLVSDLSKFVTGIVIPVDGGFSAYSGV